MIGYLAPEGFEGQLEQELTHIVARHGRLFLSEAPEKPVYWAQNVWRNLEILPFTSISEAASLLRARGALWAYYPIQAFRRSELIAKKLPFFSPKSLKFPSPLPKGPLGSWTLIDEKTLVAASDCSSLFANGEVHFQESKIPPSRAYLKLWELFTRLEKRPGRGDKCLEIGASPGSWTWVLQQLGSQVTAVDRAPLAPSIAQLSSVVALKKDAFSLSPADFPDINWLFSDLICYPEKLFEWLKPWIELDISLVCTLKFQEGSDYRIIERFAAIEGSGLIHLYHNKHELTWYRILK